MQSAVWRIVRAAHRKTIAQHPLLRESACALIWLILLRPPFFRPPSIFRMKPKKLFWFRLNKIHFHFQASSFSVAYPSSLAVALICRSFWWACASVGIPRMDSNEIGLWLSLRECKLDAGQIPARTHTEWCSHVRWGEHRSVDLCA